MTSLATAARSVRVVRPATLDEALALLAEPGAVPVAGGVGLSLERRAAYAPPPATLVAVDRLDALRGVRANAAGLTIGAAVRLEDLAAERALAAAWPMVAEAVRSVATARVRRLVTIGGNLAALDPAHDPAAALVAAGASLRVAGPGGERRVALEALAGPADGRLGPGELLVAIDLPRPEPGTGSAYAKYLVRRVWEYACVAVAAVVRLDGDGRIATARLALGSVGPSVIPVPAGDMRGAPFGDAAVESLAERAAGLARPATDARGSEAYKRRMVAEYVRRGLREAARRSAAGGDHG